MIRRLLFLMTALACGSGQVEESWPDGEQIREARESQNEAIAAHDLDAMSRFWTEDVVITASDGQVLHGAAAYAAALSGVFERFPDAVYIRTPERIIPSTVDNLALESGTWIGRWTDNGATVQVGGEYLAQWRLTPDGWLIRSELFVATGEPNE